MRNMAAKSEVVNILSSKTVFAAVEKKVVSQKDSTKRLYFPAERERTVAKTGKGLP